jgi:hypothetical protein
MNLAIRTGRTARISAGCAVAFASDSSTPPLERPRRLRAAGSFVLVSEQFRDGDPHGLSTQTPPNHKAPHSTFQDKRLILLVNRGQHKASVGAGGADGTRERIPQHW